jgi:hypothetical protein
MNFLRSAAGYRGKDQIKNTEIREELDTFNLNNKILQSTSQWKPHVLRIEAHEFHRQHNAMRRRNTGLPQSRDYSRGRNRSNMA